MSHNPHYTGVNGVRKIVEYFDITHLLIDNKSVNKSQTIYLKACELFHMSQQNNHFFHIKIKTL